MNIKRKVGTASLTAPRIVFFLIFTLSGFGGLIYESIWSHYLKLFLGHAAYAQSLVLMIFMGGMAIGSWLASRRAEQWRQPLVAYAVVELLIGVLALIFHPVFTGFTGFLYDSVLPALDNPLAAQAVKWSASTALILPQSILLGMTFPLMSTGVLRRFPAAPGNIIATLYFTNSIGAAVGVLASGFWLIALVGLPGTIATAGVVNISLAIVVLGIAALDRSRQPAPTTQAAAAEGASRFGQLLLLAAFATGAASFIYEIAWIRMLSLVLGSATHSFELMLSAFIFGLAMGGLWIRHRVDTIRRPVEFAGWVQIAMGLTAVLSSLVYAQSFEWMATTLEAVSRTSAGYAAFILASHGISLAVMLPTTFFAGMTLPLFTVALMRHGTGERAIGRIYAANTVGAIVGVLFALHIGLPALGLVNLIGSGALIDVLLGLLLLSQVPVAPLARRLRLASATILGAGGLIAIIAITDIGALTFSSGVYRYGRDALDKIWAGATVQFYADGKTSTVALVEQRGDVLSIMTNGKSDASLQPKVANPPTGDELTMALSGALPLAYSSSNDVRAAVVGFGSGLTTHTLLGDAGVTRVDTIEIEPKMVEAARGFGWRVERAYSDPRSHIYYDDAKSFFATHGGVYDIIVTEPSNPWVSGVASLFSAEYYALCARHLADDGIFVQWLQLYEFNDELAASVLKALSAQFSDYAIYLAGLGDILIVARKDGKLASPQVERVLDGSLGEDLRRLGIQRPDDIHVRQLGWRRLVEPMLTASDIPANSDFFPYVDLHAVQARFKGESATDFVDWRLAPLPILEMLTTDAADLDNINLSPRSFQEDVLINKLTKARSLRDLIVAPAPPTDWQPSGDSLTAAASIARLIGNACLNEGNAMAWQASWHTAAEAVLPFLSPDKAVAFVDGAWPVACATDSPPPLPAWRDLYRAVAARDAAGMAAGAEQLLAAPHPRFTRNYLLGAALLGHHVLGNDDQAQKLWRRWNSRLTNQEAPPPAFLRVVAAQIDGAGQVTPETRQ